MHFAVENIEQFWIVGVEIRFVPLPGEYLACPRQKKTLANTRIVVVSRKENVIST
jgi:hypothetical protein